MQDRRHQRFDAAATIARTASTFPRRSTTRSSTSGCCAAIRTPTGSRNEELLELDVDVLIPAAIGGVITAENAPRIKAPIIVEGANAPVDPDADDILDKAGTVVLPDILANAGGVTVSYFEWAQNRQFYRWNLDRVRQELDKTLTTAFEETWELARTRNVSLRTAAFMLGIDRVARAATLGGI